MEKTVGQGRQSGIGVVEAQSKQRIVNRSCRNRWKERKAVLEKLKYKESKEQSKEVGTARIGSTQLKLLLSSINEFF